MAFITYITSHGFHHLPSHQMAFITYLHFTWLSSSTITSNGFHHLPSFLMAFIIYHHIKGLSSPTFISHGFHHLPSHHMALIIYHHIKGLSSPTITSQGFHHRPSHQRAFITDHHVKWLSSPTITSNGFNHLPSHQRAFITDRHVCLFLIFNHQTTVLLLFRLLETSLSKAQLLEDWEAMTNGYIYKDDPNAESQSVKLKVSEEDEITEAETTEAETTEAETTEDDTTEAETTDAGDETAPDDVNENKRLLKKQGPRKHRSRSSRGNQNMSCVSPVESPRSRRVTDELCQRFLYPGRTRPTQSDTIGLDQRIVDNIRRHMSRTSLASSGHNIYQYNNNCRIAALTEDSSINSSGDDSQSRDCKPDKALLSTSPNASSKNHSQTRTKILANLKSKEEDIASCLQVPEKEINRPKDLSSCCVVKSPDIQFRVENELRYGGQSREDEKTIDGREIRKRCNRSLTLSPDSSLTPLSDSSSTSSDSSSSYSSSDSSSSSPESSSASSSSSLSSLSSSYTSTASSSPSSGPAPHAVPSGAVDQHLSERSNQPSDATTAHPGSTAEVGVWNEDDCWYSNGNDGFLTDADQMYANHGYMTDADQRHTCHSYQTDANQSYVGYGYLMDVNQMHKYHGYMTDVNHGYMKDVNHAYMTDANHAYMTDVNHGYMTDANHGQLTDANYGYMTDVNHGYMTDVDQRHAHVSFLTDLEMHEYLMTNSGQKAICYKSDGIIDGQESINETHLCPVITPSNGKRILDTNNCLTKLSSELNKPTSLCKSKILMGSHFTKDEICPQITPTNGVIGSIDNVLKVLSLHQTDLDEDDLEVTAISGEGQLLTNDHAALNKSGETVQIGPASPVLKEAGVHLRSLLIKPQRTHIRSYCKLNNITTLPVITSSLFPAPIDSVCRSVRLTRQRSRTVELENTDTVLKMQPLTVDQCDSIVGQSDLNFGQCDSTINKWDSINGQCDLAAGQYDSTINQCDSISGQCDSINVQCDSINGQCDSITDQCNSIVVQPDFPVSQPDSTSSDLCGDIVLSTTTDPEPGAHKTSSEEVVADRDHV
ncbi:hypothetical protein Btru_014537 [Bulinus truncatus]|nr:hypothetical protein Btru_014537 [Bulinus truncatus]